MFVLLWMGKKCSCETAREVAKRRDNAAAMVKVVKTGSKRS